LCIAAERLHERVDRHLVVFDERLVEQRAALALEEAGHLALDDLGPCLLGLAFLTGLLLVKGALSLDDLRRELVARHVAGRGALVGDVQRDVVGDLASLCVRRIDTAEFDDDADRAAIVLHVLVAVEQTIGGLKACEPSELDLLAERSRESLDELVDRLAAD